MTETSLEKFQNLLRTLFQFDCADLDFGIYRIMNYRRDVIEQFITKDLPQAISTELDKDALAYQSQAAMELKEVTGQILETLSEYALDADGNLEETYHKTKLGKRYLDLKSKAASGRDRDALEALIYSHLYTFFSRYYQDGDFISKRRYSKRQKYAIPYNGEEVYLHWANNDQYYVKTGEYFNDYRYKSLYGIIVHFALLAADVEKDNIIGDKRFFVPVPKDVTFDAKIKEITVPFQYRPLTEQEEIRYGQRNQQDAIITEALKSIPAELQKYSESLPALANTHHTTADDQQVSFLEHHLRRYTRRNTSDFFVHKDLKGFLARELDFYLKNEVLNLDELEAAGESRSEGWFQIMHIIRSTGSCIIEFLAQIEGFQKRLFEKKKFVIETQYCITVGSVPIDLYTEIADCAAQWQEWKELFHLDEEQHDPFTSASKSTKERRIAILKEHPTLVLDTKHFDQQFKDILLASFDNIDEVTDGLLIHGENFQALNLLLEEYREKVHCIHIDPPYNTQTSGFLYKNSYQHSSWLAMMKDRINAALRLMAPDSAFLCHADENEYESLHLLFERTGLPNSGTIVWDKKNPMLGRKGVATQHEYVIWRAWYESPIYLRSTSVPMIIAKAQSFIKQYGGVTDRVRREFAEWIAGCNDLSGGERAYRFIDDDGRVYQSVAMGAPEPRSDPKFFISLVHPVTKKECPVPSNGWSRAPETLRELINKGDIIFGTDETVQPRRKVFLGEESKRQISSVIRDARRGKMDVDSLGLEFPYCHPVSLYEELLGAASPNSDDVVLDYFVGSGTTAHAVISLNRKDDCMRKFILVEIGDYFDTVLLPRIKKVTFAPEWKDGEPKRMVTEEEAERSPRIVKYIRLESYEDALNNITFKDTPKTLYDFDDYLLKYMLAWETKESETLLNVEKLASPFNYKLTITSGEETQQSAVDIPETFAYILGLNVRTRRVYHDNDRRYLVYRGIIDHREVVVIWRECSGWEKKDYERDKQFVAEQKFTEGADEVFVNGDSFIPGAKALEPVFKARMFSALEI